MLFKEPEERELETADYALASTLHVTYANGDHQSLSLEARVLHPELEVAPAALNFGPVHVRAPKPLRVTLSNPTLVDAEWMALSRAEANVSSLSSLFPSLDALASAADLGVTKKVGKFRVEPSQGVLRGRGLLMPRTQVVTVWMETEDVGAAEEEIVFAVRRGRSVQMVVAGEGSLDEGVEYAAPLKLL